MNMRTTVCKPIAIPSIASALADARQRQGYSLEEAETTGLTVAEIAALEAGNALHEAIYVLYRWRLWNSNIELHDVRFSVGETAEECRDDLRRQWWGEPKSLHLDCWGEVDQADGFDVSLTRGVPDPLSQKLFFLNLGGYDPAEFGELHRNQLLVAPDARAATKKALSHIRSWSLPHKDNVFEVEKAVDVSASIAGYGLSLELQPATVERPFDFTCAYIRIG